jgi:uncharacterized membrane protein
MAGDSGRFVHKRESVEFARVLTFSDGMFAIAMTLLVVGIEVPDIPDTEDVGELWDALGDLYPSIISFVISFTVIGRYWLAHHQFFSLLKGITVPVIGLNLVYLLFIAFLPFPTGLLGNFFENPLAFAIYSVAVAAVSGMEVVMFRAVRRADLLSRPIPDDIYRWGVVQSLSPVVFFLASIPVAFLVDPSVAVVCWFLGIPLQIVSRRWKPDGADGLLGGL